MLGKSLSAAWVYFGGWGRWQKNLEEIGLIYRQSPGMGSGPEFWVTSRRRSAKLPIGAGCSRRPSRGVMTATPSSPHRHAFCATGLRRIMQIAFLRCGGRKIGRSLESRWSLGYCPGEMASTMRVDPQGDRKALAYPILLSLSPPSEQRARTRRNPPLSTNASPSKILSSASPTNWPTPRPGASPRHAPARFTWCRLIRYFSMGASVSARPI